MSNSWERVDVYCNVTTQSNWHRIGHSIYKPSKNVNLQPIDSYNIQEKRPKTSGNICNNKFKVAITPDTATLEHYQSIYTHCKQKFNIPNEIEVVKKSVYQYIENHINNYLFRNYNISEVRSNLYNNLVHYSQLGTEDLNSETLATYFQELNFNIIEYCEKNTQYKTETSNKGKQRLKQYLKTTSNTPTLQKTTARHLQTPEQETSVKLPLSITPFLILLENKSNHSESLESKETESEPEEITENKEEMTTAYIAKIPEFTGENNNTSPQECLDKVQKAEDANGWITARMFKAIPYFLQGTAGEWFENLEEPFENWQAFKDAFLQQFTNNNTFITLRNHFHNIKQETSETVMIYLGRFNKLLRQIRQLETNDYYSDAQILNQFIAGLKDKLIKKVCPHAPADLATAIRHAKSYEIAMEEANHTKLVNLAIGETSLAAEEKIDQLTKKQRPNHYYTQPSYLTIPEKSDFQQTALSKGEVAIPRSNPSNHTIPPVQIAQNANLSDIFHLNLKQMNHHFCLVMQHYNIQEKRPKTSETKTSNKGKQRLKQYSRTTSNTPTLQKTTAKHLQTPEQETSVKLPLSITPFLISLVQSQTPSLPLSRFSRPEDFQSPRNSTQQQEPILTSANIIDYLQENKSNHSESLESEETESEPEEITENKEEMTTAYIAKIPEFTGEDNDTSPQE
ncbi:hypothetical protein G9A89_001184 [Geosiphon pyriformis]|nr:hypothetical protein G9A89_001184 [Geosiphon pyriformis]